MADYINEEIRKAMAKALVVHELRVLQLRVDAINSLVRSHTDTTWLVQERAICLFQIDRLRFPDGGR